ncbi:hypothetical protein KEM48_000253 [Puccinia striiformis f. sp. tritici PST-130]|nr:hypothetical protein KEM48_000253 [Puccinia striiformis f. sp. tritici PST-130]
MPSHLRNGRDLSGEQRRRDVEAGLSILPDKGPFNALRESLPSLEPTRTTRRETNVGVTPMEVNSRATSLALRSGMSTPVPIPVDLVHVRRSQENRRPSSHESRSESAISSQELIRRVLSYEEMMDVCENWLAEAEMDIVFPKKRASNPLISSATQASTSTPSHQKGRSSPQEDVAMTYGILPRCKQRLNQPHRPHQSTRPLTTRVRTGSNSELNHAHQAVQHAMNASNYANLNVTNAPALNFMPNAMNAQAPNFVQDVTNALLRTSCRTTRRSFSKPQPVYVRAPQTPQHQQGLPATSHQAGPTPTTVRTIRTTVLEGTEITPILLDDTLHKLRELRREEKSSPDTCQTESLKDFINEK